MGQLEPFRVEADAADRILPGAVALVAEDGMARHLAVDPDLMFSPRFKNDADVGKFRRAAEHLKVGDRISPLACGDDIVRGELREAALPRPLIFFYPPFHDRKILPVKIMFFEKGF